MESKGRIFIVDDDRDLVDIMQTVVEASGYEVSTACSAREAIEAVDGVAPDLVVLDVMMEDSVAGFRMVNFLRNYEEYPQNRKYEKMPILMLTSIQQRTGMKFSQDAGTRLLPIDAFLEKPVKPKALIEKIGELLKKEA
jgi:CheY-like chemotaxis protein